jgi:hypothetical protein
MKPKTYQKNNSHEILDQIDLHATEIESRGIVKI